MSDLDKPWRLRIGLVGDVLPLRPLATASVAARAAAEPLFGALRDSDVALGNFEMPLTERGAPLEKLLNIRGLPMLADDLPSMGFDVLNIANNHTVDYGWDGLSDTIEAIEARGIRTIGAGIDLARAAEPVVFQCGSARVGVLAWSALLPTGMAATADRPGLSPMHVETGYEIDPYYQMEEPGDPSAVRIRTRVRDNDLARAISAVRALRAEVDVLIATLHWGFGSSEDLAEYQRPLAEALIDAGADAIHGHHPHAVHAIGFHHGKPILYSLGTFIGQQVFIPASEAVQSLWTGMSPDGYLASLEFEAAGQVSLTLIPTTLNAERLPEVARGAAFDRIVERLRRLSTSHGSCVAVHGDVVHVRPGTTPAGSAEIVSFQPSSHLELTP